MRYNLLVADRFQDVTHSLRQLVKRHQDSRSGCCAILAWNSAPAQKETTPAGAHWVLCDVPTYEWRLQIRRHPEIAGTRRRNANTPLHRWRGVFRALSRQSPTTEL